jgi:hypothetical protein
LTLSAASDADHERCSVHALAPLIALAFGEEAISEP